MLWLGMDGAVLRLGAVDGVGSAPAWGGARASASKKRSAWLGTATRGPVDGCSGVGQCTGVGIEEEERGAGNGWRGVEMNLDNFNSRRAFIPELITVGSNYKPAVMGVHHYRL